VTMRHLPVRVRLTEARDFDEITALCRLVYPDSPPWKAEQLASHRRVFPEGQFVAYEPETGRIVGMAASLIVRWSDYSALGTWRDFTDSGMFTNHDPAGRTLYGAEVLVHPELQRRGVGAALYKARRELCRRLGLLRIRAAARLRGYGRHASKMSAEVYVMRVVRGLMKGPTLSFQLKHGFRVLAVVPGYLQHDPESLGYAAVIEWLNADVARPEDTPPPDSRFDPSAPLPF
jgi:GNAT superfamily N-acetyltransferase